jgi:hypothetical protein
MWSRAAWVLAAVLPAAVVHGCGASDDGAASGAGAKDGGSDSGGSANAGGTSASGGSSPATGATGGADGGSASTTGGAGASGNPGDTGGRTGSASGGSTSGGAANAGGAPTSSGGAATGGSVSNTGGSGGSVGGRAACKRGVAYGFDPAGGDRDLAALAPGVTWFYNWSSSPPKTVAATFASAGVEYVPMIWGGTFDVDDVVKKIPAGSKYLLGFNEPNFVNQNQANLTPTEAAALWPKVESIADQRNLTIVSPAVNYCGGTCNVADPVEWLDQFFAACKNCRVDHVAVHWYACDGSALTWYLDKFKKYGKPLWLTEFSCGDQGTQPVSKQQSYMKDALALLEKDPAVFRYSWFSGRTTSIANVNLLGAAGVLTDLGKDYLSLPVDASCKR